MDNGFRNSLLVGGLLFVLVFAVASPGLRNEFIFDDESRITENYDLRKLANLRTRLIYPYAKGPALYRNDPARPLVYLTYTLNYAIGELDPFGYHVFDVFCHLLVALSVFGVIKRISLRHTQSRPATEIAGAAAALFAIHPVNISAVLYSYSRSMTLFSLFVVLALYAHIRFERTMGLRAAVVSLLFVLALASRQTAIVLPTVILAYDVIVEAEGTWRSVWDSPSRWRYHAWLFSVGALYLGIHQWYFGGIGDLAIRESVRWDRWDYVAHQPYAVLRYLQLLLVPVGQSFQHAIYPETLSAEVKAISAVVLTGLCGYGARALSRSRDRLRYPIAFAGVFFAAFLVPVSSVFPTAWVMDERRVYLSSAALIAAVVAGSISFLKTARARRQLMVGFALVAVLLTATSLTQARLGRTNESQWRNVLRLYPESQYALNHLALISAARGEDRKAVQYFARLFELAPGHFKGLCDFGDFNLDRGRIDLATRALKAARQLGPKHWRVRDLERRITQAEKQP